MNILVFGATGSIGSQAIEIIRKLGHKICGCVYKNNLTKMQKILNSLKYDVDVFSPSISTINTVNSIDEIFEKSKPDMVVNAISGFDGLEITLKAIAYKCDIALANKETMVNAGWFVNSFAKTNNVSIYPIDSEHCALIDLFKKNKKFKKIYITASGGPFYNHSHNDLENVTFFQAKKHPNWDMGYKISIDSATLMNKCFEIIEAYYLFGTNQIEAIYHPESIIHSMILFNDNSIHAQMSVPDMKLSIAFAISKFNSKVSFINELSLDNLVLNLQKIDYKKWKPIEWAYDIIKTNNQTMPVILNAANDAAIELFKDGKIRFVDIIPLIEKCLIKFNNYKIKNIKDIFDLNFIINQFIISQYN